MPRRFAKVDELGLVIPLPDLDCVGSECQVALQRGRCFVDEHHLYFSAARFSKTRLQKEFREHPFNRVSTPRCRHNQYHSQIGAVAIPSVDVMLAFLEEAALLQQLGVVTKEVLSLEKRLVSDKKEDLKRIACSDGGPNYFAERLEERRTVQIACLEAVTNLEVVPESLILASHVIGAQAIWGSRVA